MFTLSSSMLPNDVSMWKMFGEFADSDDEQAACSYKEFLPPLKTKGTLFILFDF